ncbi:MAG: alpha/beta hydrolase [Deltaproteobacteria bacterium]|nr:alpha/beta hydrolase [Deltaproteobacteria bacterium]
MKEQLLLLHGALGAGIQFETLTPYLENRFDVHAPDFEGHGRSEVKDRPFSMKNFSENVLEYMDANGIKQADIFGHSLGGHVGLYMAAFFTERINGVFTLGTKFLWTPEIAEKENALLDPDKIREKVPHYAGMLEERHVASGWEVLLGKAKDFHNFLAVNNPLRDEDIEKIEKKVRICLGDRDKMVTIEESLRIYHLLKDGEFQILPRTPHPLEKVPLEFLSNSICDFFN